jgi:hypothetical protein
MDIIAHCLKDLPADNLKKVNINMGMPARKPMTYRHARKKQIQIKPFISFKTFSEMPGGAFTEGLEIKNFNCMKHSIRLRPTNIHPINLGKVPLPPL